MQILVFKIHGKFAHFRKFYANNTAMSFTIPPRTSLMGIIAACMGWPRDSYYESLASENLRIGIRVMSSLKKSFHRLNLLSIKSIGDVGKEWSSDFRGEGGRIQTPFEIVSAWDVRKGEVAYQVFLSAGERDTTAFNSIKDHFLKKQPIFNITLGVANFTATIDAIELIEQPNIETRYSSDFVSMHSAIPTKGIQELHFDDKRRDAFSYVEEDMMPGDFVANNNREVRKMNRLLFARTPDPDSAQ